MSKKIFFIVLTCCLLVATFCVSFAGAPQVQSAPADIRAVLDLPDCASAPLIVPPVVEPLHDFVILSTDLSYPYSDVSTWRTLDENWSDSPSVSAGTFALTLSGLSSYSGEVAFADEGALTLLGMDSSVDYSSSVSSFTLLYTSYYSFSFEYTPSLTTISFSTVFGDEYIVEADDVVIYFSADSDFYVHADDGDIHLSERFLEVSSIFDPLLETFVSGLRALGQNVGRSFSTMANAIFINADGTGLSTFGILVVVFAAVSLGLSLTRWVLNFCSSWGKRNR